LPKKKQKTFSLPETVSNDIDVFFDKNQELLKKLGITNRTQLLIAMLENGKPHIEKYVSHVKEETQP
jgi:hypothetical protein